MAGNLDPYREWLAITSGGESHNYYELLGVRLLESDIGRINEAFRRQSDRLAPHLSGAQAALAQRLMTELTEARMTLLTPTTKRTYDQALASGRATTAEQPAAGAPKPARWRGSPAPENDDALLPPTAMSAPENASATPPQPASSGAVPLATGTSADGHPQAAQASPYPMSQPAAWPATAAPIYPGWSGPSPGAPGQAPPYGGYAAPAAGYPAGVPGYPAQPYPPDGYATQAGAQRYPPQGYAAQAPYAAAPVAAPTAVAEAAPQVSTFSAASYRAGRRRRSSSAPLVAGVLLAALAILGGVYWKIKSDRAVAANQPPRDMAPAIKKSPPRTTTPPKPTPAAPRKAETTVPSPKVVPPPPEPEKKPESPKSETPTPEMPAAAAPSKTMPETPAKTEPKAKPDVPAPAPDATASAEEAAAVSRALRAARAALAVRDTALAQEQLDQATLEATTPDTLAQVERIELLTRYVEGFWEAARGTLGKLQVAEEIKIDDEVASVVEVSQDGLTLRVGGRNREYTLATLPPKIALYLARRWLAPDDPASDVAVAAFLMTDPKGDRQEARQLLRSAAAGGIDVKPLLAELDAAVK